MGRRMINAVGPLPPYESILVDQYQTGTPGTQHQIGEVYYNSTDQTMYVWTGSKWEIITGTAKDSEKLKEAAKRMGRQLAEAKEKKILQMILNDPSLVAKRPDLTRFDQILEDSHGKKETT